MPSVVTLLYVNVALNVAIAVIILVFQLYYGRRQTKMLHTAILSVTKAMKSPKTFDALIGRLDHSVAGKIGAVKKMIKKKGKGSKGPAGVILKAVFHKDGIKASLAEDADAIADYIQQKFDAAEEAKDNQSVEATPSEPVLSPPAVPEDPPENVVATEFTPEQLEKIRKDVMTDEQREAMEDPN